MVFCLSLPLVSQTDSSAIPWEDLVGLYFGVVYDLDRWSERLLDTELKAVIQSFINATSEYSPGVSLFDNGGSWKNSVSIVLPSDGSATIYIAYPVVQASPWYPEYSATILVHAARHAYDYISDPEGTYQVHDDILYRLQFEHAAFEAEAKFARELKAMSPGPFVGYLDFLVEDYEQHGMDRTIMLYLLAAKNFVFEFRDKAASAKTAQEASRVLEEFLELGRAHLDSTAEAGWEGYTRYITLRSVAEFGPELMNPLLNMIQEDRNTASLKLNTLIQDVNAGIPRLGPRQEDFRQKFMNSLLRMELPR